MPKFLLDVIAYEEPELDGLLPTSELTGNGPPFGAPPPLPLTAANDLMNMDGHSPGSNSTPEQDEFNSTAATQKSSSTSSSSSHPSKLSLFNLTWGRKTPGIGTGPPQKTPTEEDGGSSYFSTISRQNWAACALLFTVAFAPVFLLNCLHQLYHFSPITKTLFLTLLLLKIRANWWMGHFVFYQFRFQVSFIFRFKFDEWKWFSVINHLVWIHLNSLQYCIRFIWLCWLSLVCSGKFFDWKLLVDKYQHSQSTSMMPTVEPILEPPPGASLGTVAFQRKRSLSVGKFALLFFLFVSVNRRDFGRNNSGIIQPITIICNFGQIPPICWDIFVIFGFYFFFSFILVHFLLHYCLLDLHLFTLFLIMAN